MASVSQSSAKKNQDSGVASLNTEQQYRKAESLGRIMFRRFFKHRMAVIGVFLLGLIVAYVSIGTIFYSERDANRTSIRQRFSSEFPMGTDEAGRNVLARTIYGGQISLMIGVTAVAIAITLGTAIGLLSGYFGGWIDALLMRFVEALLAIPTLVLLLVLSRMLQDIAADSVTVLGRELSASVVAIILIIGLTTWMGLSRIVRSLVLTLKEQEFVTAARALGAGNVRILLTHILPNCIAPIVVAATLGVGSAIIIETALSFLGFGVMPPTATWGNILNRARISIDTLWWLWVFPGFFITLTVLSINFIGDGLRDALDPRSTK
ncbi:MAG: ABC transporter permease [Phototrophicaceae bacterium]